MSILDGEVYIYATGYLNYPQAYIKSAKLAIESDDKIYISDISGDNKDDLNCYNEFDGFFHTLIGSLNRLRKEKAFNLKIIANK